MAHRIHGEVRVHFHRLAECEHRAQLAFSQMPFSDHCAFQSDPQSLGGRVERHLRAVEAQSEAIGRALFGVCRKLVGPLDDADIALDQRHLQQLFRALDPMHADKGGTRQRHDTLLEQRHDFKARPLRHPITDVDTSAKLRLLATGSQT